MNYASMVTDSISPSTQSNKSHKQGGTGETSFEDTLSGCSKEVEQKENCSDRGLVKEKAEEMVSELQTIYTVMEELKGTLNGLFESNGIKKDPPVHFTYNQEEDKIVVSGDRDDADTISQLINSDPEMKEELKATIEKAQNLIGMADSLRSFRNGEDAEQLPAPNVGIVYGLKTAASADRAVSCGEPCEEEAEEAEVLELFDKIKELMLMVFIQLDPEEEEKKKAVAADDNGATDEAEKSGEEEDGVTQFQRMMQQIEAARQDALAMYGTDKNKYSMAIESYAIHMKDEEEKASQTAQQKDEESEKKPETDAETVEV